MLVEMVRARLGARLGARLVRVCVCSRAAGPAGPAKVCVREEAVERESLESEGVESDALSTDALSMDAGYADMVCEERSDEHRVCVCGCVCWGRCVCVLG